RMDAADKTIKGVEKPLNGSNPKVVVCIQTDGHENASTEHTWDELNTLIKEKTAAGWQFNFLGTGIDAYDTGARMGVAAMSTMSSGRSPQHVRASYAAMGGSFGARPGGAGERHSFVKGRTLASGGALSPRFPRPERRGGPQAAPADPVAAQAQGRGRFFAVKRCRAAHRQKAHSALRSAVC